MFYYIHVLDIYLAESIPVCLWWYLCCQSPAQEAPTQYPQSTCGFLRRHSSELYEHVCLSDRLLIYGDVNNNDIMQLHFDFYRLAGLSIAFHQTWYVHVQVYYV